MRKNFTTDAQDQQRDGRAVAIEPTMTRTRAVPEIDHKRAADEDGTRRSPNPVYGNYSSDLWRSHTRSGGAQSLVRSRRRVGGRNDCEKPGK